MRRILPLCALCAALGLGAPALAAPSRAAVVDPAFGETIYAFYQKQYFDAISRVLVARERNEFRRQAAEAELLLGGLYVQYGIPDAAGEVFGRLLPGTEAGPQAQRIWLALAELNYRRDRFPEALAIIEQRFARDTAPEQAIVLAVKSLMRLGRYAEAVQWMGARVSDLPESRYLRFNLAVALVGNGDAEGGAALLASLLAAPAADDEMRALRDRVALALAATRLQQERPADALAALAPVQMAGVYSGEALLVYGIAATRNADYPKAVAALRKLAARSPHEQAVQEGWVALAQAYDAAGDDKRALKAYREALQLLDAEMKYLQAQQSAIEGGEWFAALEKRAGDIAGRDDRIGLADADVLALPLHFRQFASNRFVLAFTQYVEVSRLANVATEWQARIPVLDYLVDSRRERHARLAREAQAMLADTPLAPLAARQQALAAQVETVAAAGDPLAVASPERQRLAAFAAQVQARMARWPDRDWTAQQAKLALLRGVLDWEATREAPAQAWALRRQVRDNARLVDEAGALHARVGRAAARDVVSVEGWREALRAEDQRLRTLAQQSLALRSALRRQLEQDAVATVEATRERLVQLAADAYFGIGQLGHGTWRAQRDARHGSEAPPAAAP